VAVPMVFPFTSQSVVMMLICKWQIIDQRNDVNGVNLQRLTARAL
jgi:hypothetical protein